MNHFSATALGIVMNQPEKIKARNSGHHPSILCESVYSVNKFVLMLTKENFSPPNFLFNIYKLMHRHSHPPQATPSSWENEPTPRDIPQALSVRESYSLMGNMLTMSSTLLVMVYRGSVTGILHVQ